MIQVLFDMMGNWLANDRGWVWLRLTSHGYSRQLVRSLESVVDGEARNMHARGNAMTRDAELRKFVIFTIPGRNRYQHLQDLSNYQILR